MATTGTPGSRVSWWHSYKMLVECAREAFKTRPSISDHRPSVFWLSSIADPERSHVSSMTLITSRILRPPREQIWAFTPTEWLFFDAVCTDVTASHNEADNMSIKAGLKSWRSGAPTSCCAPGESDCHTLWSSRCAFQESQPSFLCSWLSLLDSMVRSLISHTAAFMKSKCTFGLCVWK